MCSNIVRSLSLSGVASLGDNGRDSSNPEGTTGRDNSNMPWGRLLETVIRLQRRGSCMDSSDQEVQGSERYEAAKQIEMRTKKRLMSDRVKLLDEALGISLDKDEDEGDGERAERLTM